MLETFVHRWLNIPYRLHAEVIRPKKRRRSTATLLFIHGLGNSGKAWDDVVHALPDEYTVVKIDLLGFGRSPRPRRATYNAKTQARAILRTYVALGLERPIIVGHSLGSLVAIEIAKLYPLLVRKLILCSPPLYDSKDSPAGLLPGSDAVLRDIYRKIRRHPSEFLRMASVAMKYDLINKAFRVTDENIDSYMAALESAIINQTALDDIASLSLPITIIRGRFDPVLVPRHLTQLALAHQNITLRTINAGHEVRGPFVAKVVKEIEAETEKKVQ